MRIDAIRLVRPARRCATSRPPLTRHDLEPSELLDVGPQIKLQGPRARPLQVKLIVRLGDRVGVEHRVRAALGDAASGAVALDLSVDDRMGDVYALRLELACHAPRHDTQHELADREILEGGAAAQARCRTGEENSAPMPGSFFLREHYARGLAPHEESAQAGVLPAALELFNGSIEYAFTHKAAGVVNDEAWRPELSADALEERLDVGLPRGVAGDGDRAVDYAAHSVGKGFDAPGVTQRHGDMHLGARKAACQRRAQSRARSDDNRGITLVRHGDLSSSERCSL